MSSSSFAYTGRILALLGGILMVVLSTLSLFESAFTIPVRSPLQDFNILGRGFELITLILGIVCIIGARYSNRLEWAIILIILGYVGGGIGGLLVLIGGVLGLVSALVKKT